ncbi:hypothetical protein MTO96_018252 [Rhipicephalus appendiculatus]
MRRSNNCEKDGRAFVAGSNSLWVGVQLIRACIILALATCAFAVYSGYPYGYSGAVPAAYGGYQAPFSSLGSYGYGHGHGASSYGYGLGSYGLQPTVLTTHHSLLCPTVHHAPGFGYGLGYGLPAYGYGLGSYGLSYGYGLGGLGYSTFLRKKC